MLDLSTIMEKITEQEFRTKLEEAFDKIKQSMENKGVPEEFYIYCGEDFWYKLHSAVESRTKKRQSKPWYRKERW